MASTINCSGAGVDFNACKRGAEKFCTKHQEEEWSIIGGRDQRGLVLTAALNGGYAHQVSVSPVIGDSNMAESVFVALETVRTELPA